MSERLKLAVSLTALVGQGVWLGYMIATDRQRQEPLMFAVFVAINIAVWSGRVLHRPARGAARARDGELQSEYEHGAQV